VKTNLERYECPNCQKEILQPINKEKSKSDGTVIKSKLVFINEDGTVMGKCKSCKKIIPLPFNFKKNEQKENNS
jgi:predicted RNA-binding Zn-ribbon protein involved in translation (DUF1610 family)